MHMNGGFRMSGKLLLIGSGGHCRSVIDSLGENWYETVAILGTQGVEKDMPSEFPFIGSDEDAAALFKQGYTHAVIAIGSVGNPAIRIRLYQKYKKIGFKFPVVIDPTAIVSRKTSVSEGTFIGKGAIVNTGVKIGACCIINTGAVIDHDCVIGDFVHVGPASGLSGGARVCNNSHIGIGSSVIQSVTIGENTVIGAGSAVVNDIPSDVIAVGIPCRPIKPNGG